MPLDEQDSYGTFNPRPALFKSEQEPTPEPEDEATPALPSFDPRLEEAFDGLIYLGALTKSFFFLGHRFNIRTLTQGEMLIVPMLMKDWVGTVGEAKAYVVGMVCLCIESVDGQSLPMPFEERPGGNIDWARQRFDHVKDRWFPFTIDKVYSEYLELEQTALDVVEAMGKASGPVDSTRGSNADSAGPSDKDS